MPDESREGIPGVVKIDPEPLKAILAVETAQNLLEVAKDEINERKYDDSYEDAKNAIRMASAAIMYADGYVAKTMEGAYEYFEKKRGDKELVKEWRDVEIKSPENRGFVDRLLEALRFKKKKESEEDTKARKALTLAENFVKSADIIIKSGAAPAWERTWKRES